MSSRLVLEGLTKRFETRGGATMTAAVHGLDLAVAEGELLVLVGPSGCGKSTVLRLVAGLETPTTGRVLLDGRDLAEVPPQARDVAMVFQGYALYPHLTVAGNIAFPLEMRGVGRAERERKVREAADVVGLGDKLERLPSELSGGERQRVAMARAIVRRPRLFLFDEPLSNLDAKLRAELRVELVQLIRRIGATALYVTHDQAEAMTMGDRIAVLSSGTLKQVDAPRALYERPANRFVAGFVGTPTMNLATLDEAGVSGGLRVARRLAENVGFRPESARLGAAPTPDDARFHGRVVLVEPLGAETIVHLDAGGLGLRVRVDGFAGVTVGDEVSGAVPAAVLHWFDGEGRRSEGAP